MTITQRDLMRLTALIGLTMLVGQRTRAQAPARRDSVVVAPAAPASALNARPARLNWTSDRRAYAVGDLIIVNIDENTLASANMTDNATQRRKETVKAGPSGDTIGDQCGMHSVDNFVSKYQKWRRCA